MDIGVVYTQSGVLDTLRVVHTIWCSNHIWCSLHIWCSILFTDLMFEEKNCIVILLSVVSCAVGV